MGGPYEGVAAAAQPVWAALVQPRTTLDGAGAGVGLSSAPARAWAGQDPIAAGQSGRGHDEVLAGLLQDWRELKLEREV